MNEDVVKSEESKPAKKNNRLKIVLIILAIIVILAGAGYKFFGQRPGKPLVGGKSGEITENNLPKFIQADFIDFSKIYSISKFRSGSGHDFSQGSGETCRSMKHYFNPQWTQEGERLRGANNGMPPAPDGKTDIDIYSPVDGKIIQVQAEKTPIGVQVYIQPDSQPDLVVRLFHIYLNGSIGKGSTVKAGQKMGSISQYSSTDIAITSSSHWNPAYFSYFTAMPDNLFAKYQERGVKSRDDLIITRAYRDAHPLQCKGEQFAQNYDSDPNSGNYVYLSGANTPSAYEATSTPSTPPTPSAEDLNSTSSSGSGSSSGTGAGNGSGGGNGTGGGSSRR